VPGFGSYLAKVKVPSSFFATQRVAKKEDGTFWKETDNDESAANTFRNGSCANPDGA
jgi:hypothetical protein